MTVRRRQTRHLLAAEILRLDRQRADVRAVRYVGPRAPGVDGYSESGSAAVRYAAASEGTVAPGAGVVVISPMGQPGAEAVLVNLPPPAHGGEAALPVERAVDEVAAIHIFSADPATVESGVPTVVTFSGVGFSPAVVFDPVVYDRGVMADVADPRWSIGTVTVVDDGTATATVTADSPELELNVSPRRG
jgi:hypothetical protein